MHNTSKIILLATIFFTILAAFYIYTHNSPPEILLSFDVEPVDGADAPLEIAEILEKEGVTATFFITGEYAQQYPDTVRRIAASKMRFEIACHSHTHPVMTRLSKEQQREEITKSKALLENVTGRKIKGYRAPYNMIGAETFDVLVDEGFEYDASIIDGWRIFYATPPESIKEIPISSHLMIPMEDVSWLHYTKDILKTPYFNVMKYSGGKKSYDFHPHEIIRHKDEFSDLIEHLKSRNARFIRHS